MRRKHVSILKNRAKLNKEEYYFTGNPCSRGHIDYRYTINSECLSCRKRLLRPISKRKEAKLNGEAQYFTGKPCKNGHIDNRLTLSGHCITCNKKDLYTQTKNSLLKEQEKEKEQKQIDEMLHYIELRNKKKKNGSTRFDRKRN